MYYKDLTKYEYINDGLDAVNIGWLEFGHHFEKGDYAKVKGVSRMLFMHGW